jgi:spore maturation protein CgeB
VGKYRVAVVPQYPIMKILLSGYHNPNFLTITEYFENAIKSLGHGLFVFDDRRHIIPGRIRKKVHLLNKIDLFKINREMLILARKKRPDVVIVTGGNRIIPKTIIKLKEIGVKCALWTTDAPGEFQPILEAAPHYDYIFCQGTEAVELLEQVCPANVQWLPIACDPQHHHYVKLSGIEKQSYGNDVVFVGSYYPNRAKMFEKLTEFDFGIWGPGWEQLDQNSCLRTHIKGAHTPPSTWIKIYSSSKIVLAPHYHDPKSNLPVYQASPRIFEAMACGAFVISDEQKDVFALFEDGKHLVKFRNHKDLRKKIRHFIENNDERKKIAKQGQVEVLNKHTYTLRIESLLSTIRAM